jgi:hypothetical protein
MGVLKTVTFERCRETRTIELGTNERDRSYVKQVCEGDLTQFAFECERQVSQVVFAKRDDYSLDDVLNTLETHGEDFYLSDVVSALDLWKVPYTLTEKDEQLVE